MSFYILWGVPSPQHQDETTLRNKQTELLLVSAMIDLAKASIPVATLTANLEEKNRGQGSDQRLGRAG